MRTRDTHINVRTTTLEKTRFQRNAKRCGLSLSEYLRKLANGYEPQESPTQAYAELTSLLTEIYNDFIMTGEDKYANLLADVLLELQATITPVKRKTIFP